MKYYKSIDGLDKFKDHFADFSENYIIVGGTACYLQLKEIGSFNRRTKDIDMIITVEDLSQEFGKALKKFIRDGGYKVYRTKEGVPQFFRFKDPKDKSYPDMIELFSRKQYLYQQLHFDKFVPINLDDNLSSLSAILLDDDYYHFLKSGKDMKEGLSVLKPAYLIAFKAKAYLDLSKKKSSDSMSVNHNDIKKHKNDIFRLSQLLIDTEMVVSNDNIKNDISDFLQHMKNEQIDMEKIGVEGITQQEAMSVIRSVFGV